MSNDEIADILDELDDEEREKILVNLEKEKFDEKIFRFLQIGRNVVIL